MKVLVSLMLILASVAPALAQETATLEGRLVNSLNGDLLAGATVVIDELKREVVSGPDGTFRFDNLAPGTYHVWVRAQGYSSRRTEIVVPAPAPVELRVDFDLHFQEVASVSAEVRSQFDAFQPTTVLSGQELTKQLESSLGATLENQPGLSSRSFGSAPSRPVIRGLDGDRVQILQDGQRTGDLSSQSGDHGVSVNPAAAERIEVVRGPATLLYGANAIGGLVNIITNDIPTAAGARHVRRSDVRRRHRREGSRRSRTRAAGQRQVRRQHRRRRTTRRTISKRRGQCHELALAERFYDARRGMDRRAKAHVGASYGYDDTKYGIPVVEGGTLQLTPRRHALTFRAGAERLTGAFEDVSRDARRSALPARRARRAGSRHDLQEQHDRAAGDGLAPRRRPDEGQHRRVGARSRVRRHRRRGAVAGGRSERVRGVRLRRGHVAARDAPVRRPRRPDELHAGGRAEARFHERFAVGRPAAASGRGRRSADDCRERGARRSRAGARGAVLLRRAPRQLRARGRQSRACNPSARSASTSRCAGARRAHRAR